MGYYQSYDPIGKTGQTRQLRSENGNQRHFLHIDHRCAMASAAEEVPKVVQRVRLLSEMAEGSYLGTDPTYLISQSPKESRAA